MTNAPKRDLDERHKLPVDDAEEAMKALLAVDPDSQPELSDADIDQVVSGALNDPELDGK